MKIFEEIAFKTICAVNEMRYQPVKATVKTVATVATVFVSAKSIFKTESNMDIFLKNCKKLGLNYSYEEAIKLSNENNIWIQEVLKFKGKCSKKDLEKILKDIARTTCKLFIITPDGKIVSEQAYRSFR